MNRPISPTATLRRRWVTILVATLLGTLLGAGYSLTLDREYVSSSRLYVAVQSLAGASGDPLQNSQAAQQRLVSYASLATSAAVTDEVAQDLQIPTSDLGGRVTASYPPGTVLLDIATTADSASGAQQLTAAVDDALQRLVARIETPAGGGSAAATLSVVDPPAAGSATGTSAATLIGAGLLLGLLIGLLAAYVREKLDHTVRDPAGLADALGLDSADPPTLHLTDDQIAARASFDEPNTVAIRAIRSRLQFADADGCTTVAVCGVGVDTGGVAARLARSFVSSMARTLLIEAHVPRTPGDAGRPGLVEVLRGSDVDAAVIRGADGSYDLLPAGHLDADGTDMLASRHFADLIKRLGNDYDRIVVDASLLERNPEAPAVTGSGMATVVLVEMDAVTVAELRSLLRPTLERRDLGGGRLLAVPVVVDAPTGRMSSIVARRLRSGSQSNDEASQTEPAAAAEADAAAATGEAIDVATERAATTEPSSPVTDDEKPQLLDTAAPVTPEADDDVAETANSEASVEGEPAESETLADHGNGNENGDGDGDELDRVRDAVGDPDSSDDAPRTESDASESVPPRRTTAGTVHPPNKSKGPLGFRPQRRGGSNSAEREKTDSMSRKWRST